MVFCHCVKIMAACENAPMHEAHAGSPNNMDMIQFDETLAGQTFYLGGYDFDITDKISIQGPESGIMIDAIGRSRIFNISKAQVELSNLTLKNGNLGDSGGAIWNSGNLTIKNVAFQSCNSGTHGGGIYNAGTLITGPENTGCVINACSTQTGENRGGAIYNAGTLSLSRLQITNCTSRYGGGINNAGTSVLSEITIASCYGSGIYNSGRLSISEANITKNTSGSYFGGGICSVGNLTVNNSTISGNSGPGGGGFYVTSSAEIKNCNIMGNSTGTNQSGGGIYAGGNIVIENCTIADNRTPGDGSGGGGVYLYNGSLQLIQSTVSGNSASKGGGVMHNSGSLLIRQSTLTLNAASEGGGIYTSQTNAIVQNTLIAGNSANTLGQDVLGQFDRSASGYNVIGIVNHSSGLSEDQNTQGGTLTHPLKVALGPLADNGGPILTHLLIGSDNPAVNAGNNILACDAQGNQIVWDQRGHERYADETVDIGAVEDWMDYEFELALYRYDAAGALTEVSGPIVAGHPYVIGWTWGSIPVGTEMKLYLDTDDQMNGNEVWILLDGITDDLNGQFPWYAVEAPEGQYQVGGILIDPRNDSIIMDARLDSPVTIQLENYYLVNSAGNAVARDGLLTLAEAIRAANENIPIGDAPAGSSVNVDIIRFAPDLDGQTIKLAGYELDISGKLAIQGPGSDLLTLDAEQRSRIFDVNNVSAWITGLNLTNGRAITASGTWEPGGGIRNVGQLCLADIVVSNSLASTGSGLYNIGKVIAFDCHFKNNTYYSSSQNGTGIVNPGTMYLLSSSVTGNRGYQNPGGISNSGRCFISDCLISGNTGHSNYGVGGILNTSNGIMEITGSQISNNIGYYYNGGAISSFGTISISSCSILGNTQQSAGGGLFLAGTARLVDTMIMDNHADNSVGGGIYWQAVGSIENCTISENVSAKNNGGGLYIEGGSCHILQSTISNNEAALSGGGIYVYDGTLKLVQSTVLNNYASEGGGIATRKQAILQNSLIAGNIANNLGPDVQGTFSRNSQYNVIGIVNGSENLGEDPNTQAGTQADPLMVNVGPLSDNGGPVWTHRLIGEDNLALARASAQLAVDISGAKLIYDQRGPEYFRTTNSDIAAGSTEGAIEESFVLYGPTGLIEAGYDQDISWTWNSTPIGSEISIYADPDEVINGNEIWLLRDGDADQWQGHFAWGVADLPEGTYTLGAVLSCHDQRRLTARLSGTTTIQLTSYYLVDSLEDIVGRDGKLTLREAITAANENRAIGDAVPGKSNGVDFIRFSADLTGGIIDLEGSQLDITDRLAIQGPGMETLTIDGHNKSRLFNIQSTQVWIGGLTLINGQAFTGGGIYNNGQLVLSDVALINCSNTNNYQQAHSGGAIYSTANATTLVDHGLFRNNASIYNNTSAGYGGAIYSEGKLALYSTTFTSNIATSLGGALFCANELTVDSCLFQYNQSISNYGGALYLNNSDASLINSRLEFNRSYNSGGGLYYYAEANKINIALQISNCSLLSNTSTANQGGGIYLGGYSNANLTGVKLSGNVSYVSGGALFVSGACQINDVVITNNESTQSSGGGIYVYDQSSLKMQDTLVADNTSLTSGGGIYLASSSQSKVIQTTISGNKSRTGEGGGIYNAGGMLVVQSTIACNQAQSGGGIRTIGTATLQNTLVADNTAFKEKPNEDPTEPPKYEGVDVMGVFLRTSQYNLIGIINDSQGLGEDPNTITGTENQPVDAGLEPLADNGGHSFTHALQSYSPAIRNPIQGGGGGNNDLIIGLNGEWLLYDQRGLGYNRIFDGTVEIGAYEYQAQMGDNRPPTIQSISLSNSVMTQGDIVTLLALGVEDDHGVAAIEFFEDTNLDGIPQPDEKIGTDMSENDGWSWTGVADWDTGLTRFLVRAIDDGYPFDDYQMSEVVSITATTTANQAPVIEIGTISLIANASNQEVPIYVYGTDKVSGFILNAQLGDGQGGSAEPVFQNVSFSEGIWDGHNISITGGVVSGAAQFIQASVVINNTNEESLAEGLLCTLIINTTGFDPGETFDLKLSSTQIGVDSQFILHQANELPVSIINGSVSLYKASVTGRYMFYNNSAFDGKNPDITLSDMNAIATDKNALLPGQSASFANYCSYTNGINGIMIDVANLAADITLEDLEFKVGNSTDLSQWITAPAPNAFTVMDQGGINGDDRIIITWPDKSIMGQWLQVRVKADRIGLSQDDVFYFGNAPGETGNSTASAFVDGTDFAAVRDHPQNFLNPANIANRYDFNRDRFVDGSDMVIARDYNTNFLNALKLFVAPQALPVYDEPVGIILTTAMNENVDIESCFEISSDMAERSDAFPSILETSIEEIENNCNTLSIGRENIDVSPINDEIFACVEIFDEPSLIPDPLESPEQPYEIMMLSVDIEAAEIDIIPLSEDKFSENIIPKLNLNEPFSFDSQVTSDGTDNMTNPIEAQQYLHLSNDSEAVLLEKVSSDHSTNGKISSKVTSRYEFGRSITQGTSLVDNIFRIKPNYHLLNDHPLISVESLFDRMFNIKLSGLNQTNRLLPNLPSSKYLIDELLKSN